MALGVGFATKQSGGGVSMLGYKLNLSGRELVIIEAGCCVYEDLLYPSHFYTFENVYK